MINLVGITILWELQIKALGHCFTHTCLGEINNYCIFSVDKEVMQEELYTVIMGKIVTISLQVPLKSSIKVLLFLF